MKRVDHPGRSPNENWDGSTRSITTKNDSVSREKPIGKPVEVPPPSPDPALAGESAFERASATPFAALNSRPFRLFWTTILLSLTGVWVRITAQGWLIYELTSDPFLLGLVSFCQAAPVLIASPIAGSILDRVNRRKVLLSVQVVVASAMFVLATLVATGRVEVWHVMLCAIVVGTASGFDWPARLSLVPALVDSQQLQSAVALNAAAFNGSRVIGPVVAGVLIGSVGAATCFYLNAAMYLPFVFVLATLSIDTAQPARAGRAGPFQDLLQGYRYIWGTPTIRGLLSVDIIPLMFGISYFTLAPAIARDVLGLTSQGLGLLLCLRRQWNRSSDGHAVGGRGRLPPRPRQNRRQLRHGLCGAHRRLRRLEQSAAVRWGDSLHWTVLSAVRHDERHAFADAGG